MLLPCSRDEWPATCGCDGILVWSLRIGLREGDELEDSEAKSSSFTSPFSGSSRDWCFAPKLSLSR